MGGGGEHRRGLSRIRTAFNRVGLNRILTFQKLACLILLYQKRPMRSRRRFPEAPIEIRKPLKKLKTAMGVYWQKLDWIWVWRRFPLG
jgi:hypothetical protein